MTCDILETDFRLFEHTHTFDNEVVITEARSTVNIHLTIISLAFSYLIIVTELSKHDYNYGMVKQERRYRGHNRLDAMLTKLCYLK